MAVAVTFILGASIVLQLCAAGLALWLIRTTDRRFTWIAIAVAILLMVVRGAVTLAHLSDDVTHLPDVAAETVVLVTSILMVIGVAGIGLLFAKVQKSREELLMHQETLRRSEERFRQLAELAPQAIIEVDSEGRFRWTNKKATEYAGRSADELIDSLFIDQVILEDRQRLQDHIDHILSGQQPGAVEYTARRKNGTTFAVETHGTPIVRDGRIAGLKAVIIDITERKQARKEHESTRVFLQSVIDELTDAITVIDRDHTVTLANRVVRNAMKGRDPVAARLKCYEVSHRSATPCEGEDHPCPMKEVFATKAPVMCRHRHYDAKGRVIDVEVLAAPIFDEEGEVVQVIESCRDITERKALEDHTQRLATIATIVEQAAEGIVVADLEGTVRFANHAWAAMHGYGSSDELVGKNLSIFHTEEQLKTEASPFNEEVRQRGLNVGEVGHVRKNGTVFPTMMTTTLLDDDHGTPYAMAAFAQDITERERHQAELARAKRLETAGQLAGQIAHDFNNLLGPLMIYPEMARRHLPADSDVHRMLDIVENCATQMADINQNLLTLSRRGHYTVEPLDLNTVIAETLQSVTMPETVIIDTRLDPELFLFKGGRAQIQRVLVNLLTNARDAVGEAGRITIATDNVNLDSPLTRHGRIEKGEYVRIQMTDNGSGIPPEVIDRIFDPFFTTKTTDKHRGTGLGLSIVHSVVEDHEGYVDIASTLDHGTTISLYFPICRDTVRQEPIPSEVPRGAGQSILIVDDDPNQRQVVQDALTELGYDVTTAASGEEAVPLAQGVPYDMLVLDMVMDGIDGAETLRRIRASRPDQAAILLSGYATNERVEDAVDLGISDVLAKPIRVATLAVAIHRALRNATRAGCPPAEFPA